MGKLNNTAGRQSNTVGRLNNQLSWDARDFRYSILAKTWSKKKEQNEDALNEKEIIEILWDIKKLTLEKVQDLLNPHWDISLITNSVTILLLIAKKNKDLLNALWYEKNKNNWISKSKKDAGKN